MTAVQPAPARVVIPGDEPPQLQGSPHLERLRRHAEVVLYTDRPAGPEEQLRRARDAVCILNSRGGVHWPGELLRQLPRLRMISVCGIGTDAIDLDSARELGIAVCNIPGRTAPIVAEHALALMLGVARRAWYQTNELKQGRWTGLDNVYLRGKTLGLLGAGSIAWPSRPPPGRAERLGVRFVSFEGVLAQSNVLSAPLPLTERTRGLLGA